jgi:hypothetical protein
MIDSIMTDKSRSMIEAVQSIRARFGEEKRYITKNGLCPVCKVNKISLPVMRCTNCLKESLELLDKLQIGQS